jgi:hypothetical protein
MKSLAHNETLEYVSVLLKVTEVRRYCHKNIAKEKSGPPRHSTL